MPELNAVTESIVTSSVNRPSRGPETEVEAPVESSMSWTSAPAFNENTVTPGKSRRSFTVVMVTVNTVWAMSQAPAITEVVPSVDAIPYAVLLPDTVNSDFTSAVDSIVPIWFVGWSNVTTNTSPSLTRPCPLVCMATTDTIAGFEVAVPVTVTGPLVEPPLCPPMSCNR